MDSFYSCRRAVVVWHVDFLSGDFWRVSFSLYFKPHADCGDPPVFLADFNAVFIKFRKTNRPKAYIIGSESGTGAVPSNLTPNRKGVSLCGKI